MRNRSAAGATVELDRRAPTMDKRGGLHAPSDEPRPLDPNADSPVRILPLVATIVLAFSACTSSGGPATESATRTGHLVPLAVHRNEVTSPRPTGCRSQWLPRGRVAPPRPFGPRPCRRRRARVARGFPV